MGVSKVEYGDTTLIDLTNDTVTEDTLKKGFTAHGADGELIEGKMTGGGANIWVGTQEEWDALDKSTIEDGTEVHIIDDAGDVTYRLIKTYDDLMDNTDDNKLVDALVVKEIAKSGGASTWSEVAEKPFETIGQNLEVVDGVLNATCGGSVPENIVLHSPSEEEVEVPPIDADKLGGELPEYYENELYLANESTPSTPSPRDADTLGGQLPSYYAKASDIPDISKLSRIANFSTNCSTFKATTINGWGMVMIVSSAGITIVNVRQASEPLVAKLVGNENITASRIDNYSVSISGLTYYAHYIIMGSNNVVEYQIIS